MTWELLTAAVVGAVMASVVATIRTRRRQRAVHEFLDQYDDGGEDGVGGGLGGVLARLRRLGGQLAESARVSERTVDRLERTLDRMAEGVVVCDEHGRVVFTNSTGAVLADARHEDALVAAAVTDCLGSAVRGDSASRSVGLFGPPARTITVEAHPLGDPERPIGAVATVADESRLRRLESVRTDFIANVSHELKTPIGGLAVLAEALSEAVDADEQERLSGRLLHEAHRLGRVVDDLLALNAVESDLTDRREPVAASDLVARAAGEVAVLAEGHGVEITTDVTGDLWVDGDPVQLASALGNLVENAVKYSGGASPVTVAVTAEDGAEGGAVCFTVEDRGIGIPRQDVDRVFERFYRVDRARSDATGGTGLGLALVRNIVRRHGGEVDLTSREGEGTTVVIRLPAADRGDADRTARVGPGGAARGGHG